MGKGLESWGRYPRAQAQQARPVVWASDSLPAPPPGGSLLPYGQGRSYGDSCLNEGGTLLTTSTLDRLLAFNPATGVLRCEAGTTLDTLLRLITWQGWFLPVTPGTRYVSVGGAIANDVHGKNHHQAGTFGRHVRRFELLRSDGTRRVCSPEENADWYAATIGGLGLTGLITWAEVQLRRMSNPYVLNEAVPFGGVDEFLALSRESAADYEFTVAWVDSLARGRSLGRGLFYRGNHAPPQLEPLPLVPSHLSRRSRLAVPVDLPGFCLNRLSVAAFNWLYYHRQRGRPCVRLVHYDPFFYPLDAVYGWNRIYGRRGFVQFQCVIPPGQEPALREVLERSARSGMPSFLTVMKTFGEVRSPGLLSFPRPGVTLALDFAWRGERTRRLLAELEQVTRESGGRLYPAKDSGMSPEGFAAFYPEHERLAQYIDPAFSSSFWRRVRGRAGAEG